MKSRSHLFRARIDQQTAPVTYIELFFDLVFVFAITQLSQHLLTHLTIQGALQTLLLFMAVWGSWIYTCWSTNWLDPEQSSVRLMLIGLMVGGLVLSTALPDAFEDSGVLFVSAYVAVQLGRSFYMIWASVGVSEARAKNFKRISFWFLLSIPFWIAGTTAGPEVRLVSWSIAAAIEYAAPFFFFRTPGLGRSTISDWDICGGHMAERCALIIIIALGEAVLVTGTMFAKLPHNHDTWSIFLLNFASSAAMWWIYFDFGAKRGSLMIAEAGPLAGLVARNAYTYLHMPIIIGIIVTAVGDQLVLQAPREQASLALVATSVGGPSLFLFGNQAFKWMTSTRKLPPLSHFIGEGLLGAVGASALIWRWEARLLGPMVLAALVLTAAWEWFSLHGGWQRWAPWIGTLFARLDRTFVGDEPKTMRRKSKPKS